MGFEIPASCTLPTAQYPIRAGEFEALFATARRAQRLGQRHPRVCFAGGPSTARAVREWVDRETACCSFFDFTVTADSFDRTRLDIRVPDARADVLDGLAQLVGVSSL